MYPSGYDLYVVSFFSLCPEDNTRNILSDTAEWTFSSVENQLSNIYHNSKILILLLLLLWSIHYIQYTVCRTPTVWPPMMNKHY